MIEQLYYLNYSHCCIKNRMNENSRENPAKLVCGSSSNSYKQFATKYQALKNIDHYSICLSYSSQSSFQKIMQSWLEVPKKNLVQIRLECAKLPTNAFELLSKNNWSQLKMFLIQACPIGQQGAELISKYHMPLLQKLKLSNCKVGDNGAKHISKANWPLLKQLELWFNSISAEGVNYISNGEWRQLTSLLIYESRGDSIAINKECIKFKFDFPKLQELSFGLFELSDELMMKVDKEKQCLLKKLKLYGCNVHGKYLFDLEKNTGWPDLEELWLGESSISKSQVFYGISNICLYRLSSLKILYFVDYSLSKSSIKQLVKANWHHLNELTLRNCLVQSESINLISKCLFEKLFSLTLSQNYLSNQGLDTLNLLDFPIRTTHIQNVGKTAFGIFSLFKLKGRMEIYVKQNNFRNKGIMHIVEQMSYHKFYS